MATLTALKFATPDGADRALETVKDLADKQLIEVQDAAVVRWDKGKRKPKTREIHDLKAAGALSGAFWGMLFGLIFLVPLLGAAIGAATGALAGSLTDVGIKDDFIQDVRRQVTPGTSALFLLTSSAVIERVAEAMRQHKFEILATNLSTEDEDRLRSIFEEEPSAA